MNSERPRWSARLMAFLYALLAFSWGAAVVSDFGADTFDWGPIVWLSMVAAAVVMGSLISLGAIAIHAAFKRRGMTFWQAAVGAHAVFLTISWARLLLVILDQSEQPVGAMLRQGWPIYLQNLVSSIVQAALVIVPLWLLERRRNKRQAGALFD